MAKKYRAAGWLNGQQWFEKSGEFRQPKEGEYYLSGAIPEVYKALINDLWDYGIFDDHNDPFCLTSAYLVVALHELHSKDHVLDDEIVMAAYQILHESGIEMDCEDFTLENPLAVVE